MQQQLIVAIIAGLVSVLCYGSVLTGSTLAIVPFYLAAVPLYIAGLGWGWVTAFAAAAASVIVLAFFGGTVPSLAFLAVLAAPAAWFSYLLLLARPGANQTDIEWYPPGRLLVWMAGIACLYLVAAYVALGGSAQTLHLGIRNAMTAAAQNNPGMTGLPPPEEFDAYAALFVRLIPMAGVISWMLNHIMCIYLAGRMLRAAGRLRRPWPVLRAIAAPRMAIAALCLALLGGWLSDFAGFLLLGAAAGFLFVQTLIGLAVMHTVTLTSSVRPVILTAVYLVLALLSWPALVLALLGIADNFFGLRAKALARKGPPSSPPPPATGG